MRFAHHSSQEEETAFPMAAMVDIIFLLLAFFVSTSVFYRLEAELDITIPVAEEAQIPLRTSGKIIINVKEDGSIIVNQRHLTIPQLTDLLRKVSEHFKGQAVIVRGDEGTRHGDVVKVYNACAKAGIAHLGVAALKDNPETSSF